MLKRVKRSVNFLFRQPNSFFGTIPSLEFFADNLLLYRKDHFPEQSYETNKKAVSKRRFDAIFGPITAVLIHPLVSLFFALRSATLSYPAFLYRLQHQIINEIVFIKNTGQIQIKVFSGYQTLEYLTDPESIQVLAVDDQSKRRVIYSLEFVDLVTEKPVELQLIIVLMGNEFIDFGLLNKHFIS